MRIHGRRLNSGNVTAEAFVLDFPFSFVGDFDPNTGCLLVENHPMFGISMAGKILVCPEGIGGTMAPFILYKAMECGCAPVAILCNKISSVLYESAVIINIPIFDSFKGDITKMLETGQLVTIIDQKIEVN